MKNASLFPDRFRPLWLLFVIASATAMSLYLLDPYSPPLPRWVCCVLTVATWATVAYTWDRCLRLNRAVRPGVLLLLATLVLLVTSTLQLSAFRCVPPLAARRYLALEVAVKNKDLDAAQAILARDNQPDYVPAQDSGCYAVEECSNRERPLDTAVRADDTAMVQLLLQDGAKANDADGNSSALLQAIRNSFWHGPTSGQYLAIFALLSHGANPNSFDLEQCRKWSALQLARRQDDIPLAKMLKEAGAREHAAFPQEKVCDDGVRE